MGADSCQTKQVSSARTTTVGGRARQAKPDERAGETCLYADYTCKRGASNVSHVTSRVSKKILERGRGETIEAVAGRIYAAYVAMQQNTSSRRFFEHSMWIPLESVHQLTQSLKVLQAWAKANEPLAFLTTVLIRRRLEKIDHLLDLGTHSRVLVPTERWKQVVRELQLLTELLTARR